MMRITRDDEYYRAGASGTFTVKIGSEGRKAFALDGFAVMTTARMTRCRTAARQAIHLARLSTAGDAWRATPCSHPRVERNAPGSLRGIALVERS